MAQKKVREMLNYVHEKSVLRGLLGEAKRIPAVGLEDLSVVESAVEALDPLPLGFLGDRSGRFGRNLFRRSSSVSLHRHLPLEGRARARGRLREYAPGRHL